MMNAEQEKKLNDIHDCLIGNKIKGQRGLIDRVDIHENEISHLKKTKANRFDWSKFFSLGFKIGSKAAGI